MDLSDQTRCCMPDACFICQYAGKSAIIWPQSTVKNDGWKWNVFVNSKTPDIRTKHREIAVCDEHGILLAANWVNIAEQEVILYKAWSDWIDRVDE